MTRHAIDPVTRVNGHLRIEVEVANHAVSDAWSSGQMFRGLELILEGRDPRDAWLIAQRTCGRCGIAHALGSVQAVEDALGVTIPTNARLVRNLIAGSQDVVALTAGFYLRQVRDWVDPTAAIGADPAASAALARSLSDRPNADTAVMKGARDRLSASLAGRPQGFTDPTSQHPACTLAPEPSLMVLAHFLEAIDWQREMNRLQVLLGGKSPHPQTLIVGGMALTPPWGGPRRPDTGQHPWQSNRNAPSPLSADGLDEVAALIDEARTFVDEVYVPDVLVLADHYREWGSIGTGIGHYLSFGAYPEDAADEPTQVLPRGRIMDRSLSDVVSAGQSGVAESVAHSYYADDAGTALRHPWAGVTAPAYAGPRPPFKTLKGSDRYSWLKAPRYEDDPMEVGPAARMLVAYASGVDAVVAAVDDVTSRIGLPPEGLGSTLGRIVARAVEARVVVDRLAGWLDQLRSNLASGDLAVADITRWDPATWPSQAQGSSIGESPDGAVGHWLRIEDRRIATYQIVDATTWNGSPRDQRGRRGAIEEALIGTPLVDPARPVEVLRTVHSFDPCLACAVH
jgi:Ni,Fe-hydrogenase I large subunit